LADPLWCFPLQTRGKAKALHRIFDPYRDSAGDQHRVKCSASEVLRAHEMLRYIVAKRVPRIAALDPQLASVSAACDVLDVLTSAKRGTLEIRTAAVALQRCVSTHMALHVAAYGEGYVRPKFHWNFDLPAQLLRDGMVIDSFIIERRHLQVKAVAEPVRNTTGFERSVLAGITNASLRPGGDGCIHGLLGRAVRRVSPGIAASRQLKVYGLHVECGDVVTHGDAAGIVSACLSVDGTLTVAVELLAKVGEHTPHWGCWELTGSFKTWIAAHIVQCVAWKAAGGSAILVLQ
jgi:hypothetical protein